MFYDAICKFDPKPGLGDAIAQLIVIGQIICERLQSTNGVQRAPAERQSRAQREVHATLDLIRA